MFISLFAQHIVPMASPNLQDRSLLRKLWTGFRIDGIQEEDGIGKPTAWTPFEPLEIPGHAPCAAPMQDLAILTLSEDASAAPTIADVARHATAEGYALARFEAVLSACVTEDIHRQTADVVGRRPIAIIGDALRRPMPDGHAAEWRYATIMPIRDGRFLCQKNLRAAEIDRNGSLGPFTSGLDTAIFLAKPSR